MSPKFASRCSSGKRSHSSPRHLVLLAWPWLQGRILCQGDGGSDRGELDRPLDLGRQVYLAADKAGAEVCSSRWPRCRRSARVCVHESIRMGWGRGGGDDGGCHVFILMPRSSFIACIRSTQTTAPTHTSIRCLYAFLFIYACLCIYVFLNSGYTGAP